jgi:hypothetical protein
MLEQKRRKELEFQHGDKGWLEGKCNYCRGQTEWESHKLRCRCARQGGLLRPGVCRVRSRCSPRSNSKSSTTWADSAQLQVPTLDLSLPATALSPTILKLGATCLSLWEPSVLLGTCKWSILEG